MNDGKIRRRHQAQIHTWGDISVIYNLMGNDPVLGLFKFGSREHIESFAHGTLYMNTLQYFENLEADEDGDLRSDPFEGVGSLLFGKGAILSVKIGQDFQPVGGFLGPVRWRPTGGIKASIFCMYALRPPQSATIIDERNLRFGDTFAVLTDGDEFLRRVKAAAKSAGHNLEYRLVEYFDEQTHQGEVGIFRKRTVFSYQSELRIALIPGVDEPYRFAVGDLSDITQTGSLSDLNQRLRITIPQQSLPKINEP